MECERSKPLLDKQRRPRNTTTTKTDRLEESSAQSHQDESFYTKLDWQYEDVLQIKKGKMLVNGNKII